MLKKYVEERIIHRRKDDTFDKKDYLKKRTLEKERYAKERLIRWRKDDTFEKKYTSKEKRRSVGKITHVGRKTGQRKADMPEK